MEQMLSAKTVAKIMECSMDTARKRMKEMRDVIDVGTPKRSLLMVPQTSLEDWFRNHRIATVRITVPEFKLSRDNRLARMDRRTGKLKAI
jgi:hypothetical protein